MRTVFTWVSLVIVAILAVVSGVPHGPVLDLTHFHGPLVLGVTTALSSNVLTLADWAKRLEPDGEGITTDIIEQLNISNEVLTDMLWLEGNLPTGHRTTVRTGLPSTTWRVFNVGVQPSKSTTVQFDEMTGKMEAWSEVDKALAELNGDVAAFRWSEAQAFIESMNQTFSNTLFYGSTLTPESFVGLSSRYGAIAGAANSQNIINGGGAASANASIWLVVWGNRTFHGIFPKGTRAGLQHYDHGEETAETSATIGGTRLRVYREQFVWDCGIALRDWRYVSRFANIDTTNLTAEQSPADMIKGMIKMIHKIPTFKLGRAAFYMNRTLAEMLDIQRYEAVQKGGQLDYKDVNGQWEASFRGIPIRRCDSLLNTESTIV